MEFATSIASTVIGEYLVKPTINQLRYLFCFNNIAEELDEAEEELQAARHGVEENVKVAESNTETIKEAVQVWLKSTSNILNEVQTLKGKIEVNKTCLNGWCPNLGCRYWLGRKAAKKTSIMLKLKDGGRFETVGRRTTLPGIKFLAPKDFELFQSPKFAFDEIIKALKNDNTHTVILYGMGGTGKTTLANAVGNNVKEMGIFNEVVMAVVSQTPNFRIIQDRLAESLNVKFEENTEEGRAQRLFLRFSDFKSPENKILIILDDIWEEFNFQDKIGIQLSKYCKILLTTRHKNVCTVRESQTLIPLNVLKEDEGLALLKMQASIGDDSDTLNALAIEVARECDGLPLALVTIGRSLRGKDIEEWKVVCEKLKNSKLEDIHFISAEKSVYAILELSFDYLKDEKIQLCFLLCSLFPEDFEIPLEELVRYMMGLNLCDVDYIGEARMHLRSILKHLKALGLLLEAGGEEFVKMHDLVRDVALSIASKRKNVFMSKTGMSLRDWSNVKGWEQYTAISSVANKIEELPSRLVCPKLDILLLSGIKYNNELKVSDEYFKEMKGVKVMTLSYIQNLSLKSIQFLTNLKTLELIGCKSFREISFLGKLSELEILSIKDSWLEELPKELGDLSKLRLLDLRGCYELKIIPSNVITRLSQLEELYMGESFKEYWETSEDGSNASFSELSSLSRLAILSVEMTADWFAEDFPLPELVKYDICVNPYKSYYEPFPNTNALRITTIDATSMIVFKALYHTLEYLVLKYITDCQNIIPTINQGGLMKLRSLEIEECDDLKCVIDMSQRQVPANALSSLETIEVLRCDSICSLFSAMLPLRLHKLKEVTIYACNNLQEVFQLEEPFHFGEENLEQLSSLTELKLEDLPELRCIWKGHTGQVSLKSLTVVEVAECGNLTYLFTMSLAQSLVQLKSLIICGCDSLEHLVVVEEGDNNKGEKILSEPLFFSKLESILIDGCEILEYIFPVTIAGSFVQLEALTIRNAPQLKHVFYLDHGREEIVVAGECKEIVLPNFKRFTFEDLANFISFCPENYHSTWQALEEITTKECPNLATSFVAEVVAKVQDVKEKLRVLDIRDCYQLCDGILSQFRYGGLPSLERLTISHCGVKVIFQLEGLVVDGQELNLSLPGLKYMSLTHLEELEGLYRGPAHILNLQNLTYLWVSDCQKLKHIFSPTFVGNLLQLDHLDIKDCGELEQLIVEDDDKEDQNLLKDHLQPLFFPNLSSITIRGCHKLKSLFPITVARSLQQLERLDIEENFQLEEVFGHKDGADIMDCKEILMLKLRSLSLKKLPSLTNFCLVGYHFIFPSLQILEVKDCPKIITRFSFAQNKSVHAQAKAPEMEKEDGGAQFPPEPAVDIHCRGAFQENLPAYMEN